MLPTRKGCKCQTMCLLEILLRQLQTQSRNIWPGADGLTVEEVLAEYPRAARAGLVPGAEQLAEKYPDLATEIRQFVEQGTVADNLRCQDHGC